MLLRSPVFPTTLKGAKHTEIALAMSATSWGKSWTVLHVHLAWLLSNQNASKQVKLHSDTQTNKQTKKHVSAISWMQNFLLFYDPNSHLCRRLVPQFVFAEAKLFLALSGPRASSKAGGMNAAGFLAQGTPGCFMQFWMHDQKVHICMYVW